MKIRFVAAILKRNIFLMFFLLIYVYGASFVPKFLRKST